MKLRPVMLTRLAAVLVCVLALCSACSVSTNEKTPRALGPDELPPELQTPTPSVATSLPSDKPHLSVYVYDPQAKRLTKVTVAAETSTPDAALQALVASDQIKEPLTTDIPTGLTLGRTTTTSRRGCATLRIPVSDELSTLQGDQQRIAVAQLVYTATQFPDVECVTFNIKGQGGDVEVPTGAKGGTAMVVSRKDYRDIAPKESS